MSYFNDEAGYMAAQRALTELHDTTLDDITYKCELSNIIDAPPSVSPHAGPGAPYQNMGHNHNGMGYIPNSPHGPGVGPLSPMSDFDFGAESPAQQSSYFDDFAASGGIPAGLGAPGARGHHSMYPGMMNHEELAAPVLEKSNSGGGHSLAQSSSGFTTNASMSLSSSKQPSRTSSLEKDSLSPGALDFRTTPPMPQDGSRPSSYAPPSVPGHFGRSPGRAAISASPLLSSYQTVGAPLAGGPVGMPRAPPAVQRPYHHAQQAPQQGQYPSQSRYQPNRDGSYLSPQLSHLGVAGGMNGMYEASPQNQAARRGPSLTGSPQMPSPGYWNPQQGPPQPPQVRAYQQHPHGSPSMAHSSPRGAPANNFNGYGQHQQQQHPQQGAQPPRYSPQQHYAPQSRVNTQGLHLQPPVHHQQPPHHQQQQQQQQQAPLYARYSPPTQYAQPTLSPSHLNNLSNHSPHGQGSPFFTASSRSNSGSSDQGLQLSSPGHPAPGIAQQQVQSQGPAPGPGFVGGYNPQNREFHPAAPARGLQIEAPAPLPSAGHHFSPNTSHNNNNLNNAPVGRLYGDLGLESSLLNNNNSHEGLGREDYFGLSNTNTNNNNQNATTSGAGANTNSGWFQPSQQDLPLM